MNVKRRLIFQYIRQLLLVGLVLLVLILGAVKMTVVQLDQLDQESDFVKSGLPVFTDSITERGGSIQIVPKLLAQVKQQGGWLQVIDETGAAIVSYDAPADVPARYNPGELMSYWRGEMYFPYALYVWIQQLDAKTYTLLYGVKNTIPKLKSALLQEVTWRDGRIEASKAFEQELNRVHGSIQLLDGHGKVLATYGQTIEAPERYSVQALMLHSQYPNRYGSQLYTVHDKISGNTWVLLVPLPTSVTSSLVGDTYKSVISVFLWNSIGLLFIILILFLLFALWYGHRFGTPILHMIDWLQHLSKGELREPSERKGHGKPRSRDRSGRLKRRFRTYAELMESLEHLTETLQKNERIRKQLEKTREDWIAGVSHDMKTPLSSIMGYAHIMETNTYEWSQAEIREFAEIIREKSCYMDDMINDLTLTYRLKNEAFTFQFVPTEMNEFIDRTIQQWKRHPQFANVPVHYSASEISIVYPIDPKFFRRILENLLANAALHNPEGTRIDVSLTRKDPAHFVIMIRDYGVGMNEETMSLLFERYYRGTNTEGLMQGTGLGMAISKQLVIQHQGQIEVKSQTDSGTTISLIFGCVKSDC